MSALLFDELELPTKTSPSSFHKAARRLAKGFSWLASTKQPFVISGSRPEADGHYSVYLLCTLISDPC